MRKRQPVPGEKGPFVVHAMAVEMEKEGIDRARQAQVQSVEPQPRVGAVMGEIVRRGNQKGPPREEDKQQGGLAAVGEERQAPEGEGGCGLEAPRPPCLRPGEDPRERPEDLLLLGLGVAGSAVEDPPQEPVRQQHGRAAQGFEQIETAAEVEIIARRRAEASGALGIVEIRPVDPRAVEAMVHEVPEAERPEGSAEQGAEEAPQKIVRARPGVEAPVKGLVGEVPEGLGVEQDRQEQERPEGALGQEKNR